MSSNKTPNYNLHTWDGGDFFKREEFNENFDTIDNELKVQSDENDAQNVKLLELETTLNGTRLLYGIEFPDANQYPDRVMYKEDEGKFYRSKMMGITSLDMDGDGTFETQMPYYEWVKMDAELLKREGDVLKTASDKWFLKGSYTGEPERSEEYGIDLHNSDIVGVNNIIFNDPMGVNEGLYFPKASIPAGSTDPTDYDKLSVMDGRVYLNDEPMIQAGSVSVVTTANSPVTVRVNFAKPFKNTPSISVTANTSVPGSKVLEVSFTNASKDGFDAVIYRTDSFSTNVHWQAVPMTQ